MYSIKGKSKFKLKNNNYQLHYNNDNKQNVHVHVYICTFKRDTISPLLVFHILILQSGVWPVAR